MHFLALQWIFHLAVARKNHVIREPDCGIYYIISEKQACIVDASRQNCLRMCLYRLSYVRITISQCEANF